MFRLLYESSVAHRGHLIIPYPYSTIAGEVVYSYKLLSALGYKGPFHKVENPAGLYSNQLKGILGIAKEHLDQHIEEDDYTELFKGRYTYRDNLIIVYQTAGKCFYDHYPPQELNNIAAPKLFRTEPECLGWVKQGLDRNYS